MATLSNLLTPIDVDLDQLLLDPNNPRFAELGEESDIIPESRIAEKRVQEKAYEKMLSPRFDVTELRDTIKTIGYLPMDRIVVRSWKGKNKEKELYVVIEGNRRVTALKWLIELHETGRETFSEEQLNNFNKLPALLLDVEKALCDYNDETLVSNSLVRRAQEKRHVSRTERQVRRRRNQDRSSHQP